MQRVGLAGRGGRATAGAGAGAGAGAAAMAAAVARVLAASAEGRMFEFIYLYVSYWPVIVLTDRNLDLDLRGILTVRDVILS
jgi:hypothetical protein